MSARAARRIRGRILVRGNGRDVQGPLLRLRAPVSFWGGIDPLTGAISDLRHPDHGVRVGGTVLAVPATVGSSSSSAIMLEMIREGTAPVALILGRSDAIVALGVVVARELGRPALPVLEAAWPEVMALSGGVVRVDVDGWIEALGASAEA